MRLFLAQSAEIFDYGFLQESLSKCFFGHWRTQDSLHATVLFLGNRFPEATVIDTVTSVPYVLESAPIRNLDVFEHNRILYAASEHPTLVQTYNTLGKALGMEEKRAYIPHVTLMRYKYFDRPCFEKNGTDLEGRVIGRLSGPLQLMKSTLTPEGAVYELVHQF